MPNQNQPYYPSQAAITAQAGVVSTGQTREQYGTEGLNLFSMGSNEAMIEKAIMFKYMQLGQFGKYFLHNYMKIFGKQRQLPVFGSEHGWYEMGRTRYGMTIGVIVSGDTTPLLIVSAATGPGQNSFLVGDILNNVRLGGSNVRIEAVNETTSPFQYTLKKMNGTVWTAADDLAVGDVLGLSHSAFGQETGQPKGRRWSPELRTNKLTLLKATSDIGGSAYTTKSELILPNGQKLWAYVNHMLMMDAFCTDRENAYMWSQETADNAPEMQGRGLFHDIYDNSLNGLDYGATLDETDFRSLIQDMKLENGSKHFLVLPGYAFMQNATVALAPYTTDGAVKYGSFALNEQMAVGLNITQYNWAGVILEFGEYSGFSDQNTTGFSASAPIATAMDFANFALVLNLGENGGTVRVGGVDVEIPYLSHVYKALDGVDRSLVVGMQNGMTGRTNSIGGGNYGAMPELQAFLNRHVSTDVDQDKYYVLSEVGVRLAAADCAHGWMRKSA